MKHSTFLNINWQDIGKGAIVAGGGGICYYLLNLIPSLGLSPEANAMISAGITYLLKNFFTPTPKTIHIDPAKTTVVDSTTKQPLTSKN
jgi:hypothetical protein